MENMWRTSSSESETGIIIITYTLAVVTLIFVCQFIRRFTNSSSFQQSTISSSSQQHTTTNITTTSSSVEEDVISDLDLQVLMDNLDESEEDKWVSVVCRKNDSLCYSVKCCKPKDGGPLKYSSTTTFNNFCCCETLRDFYMDNFYRMEWDKTLIQHQQLQLDETNGTEFGRIIKKFPLLTPREYILAWRLWEGTQTNTTTYYCYTKECEHPLAPTQNKYVRVSLFRSGWRIRKVPGKNSCQIKMLHQEDAGLNAEMAKMIFAKGIWTYVCKMDTALRNYSAVKRIQLTSTLGAITFLHKVPLSLDSANQMPDPPQVSEECNNTKLSPKPSKKFIANGLIIVGGVICLARGHTNFSAKVAMAYILSKLTKRREPSLH